MKKIALSSPLFSFILAVILIAGCSEESAGPEREHPPGSPHSPVPADGATAQDTLVTLSWECSDPDGDDLDFTVYIQPEGGSESSYQQSDMSCDLPEALEPETEYTWRVKASDGGSSTTGNSWSFTTCSASDMPPSAPENPSPPDLSTGQSINPTLSWECSDPNLGDTLVYDLYFGELNPPALLADGLTGSSYQPGPLDDSTTYFWSVTAEDETAHRTSGPVWRFTTGSEPGGEGVFALLVAGRNLTFFDPVIVRTDGLFARFDSSFAPCVPVSPLHPTSVECNQYTLEWDDITGMYKYDRTTPPLDFLVTGESYTFEITASQDVPSLSKSIDFPQCEPYLTSPANYGNVSRSGFTANWQGHSCGGDVRLAIIAQSGDTTGVDVMTDNDGSYTFSSQQLSSISGPQPNCSIILILQNSDAITEAGYDPRSYIWARVINTTIINFID
ncbi:MAG: hypothetical protein GF417_13290 [Candidatus Latescibacteria bacterium]|nr:hypothetical protein [bacterium]MBD3425402.1 hypothetical protein [Candidatus Latescibacterota bacterium]